MAESGNPSIADALNTPVDMDSSHSLSQPDRFRSTINHTTPELEFHGPSSLLFDEAVLEQEDTHEAIAPEVSESVDSVRLMAEAAAQRASEEKWLLSHAFDSDGIDHGLVKELLSLYWKTANSAYLLVYRPAFMRDFASNGRYFSKILLNAMYYSACRHIGVKICEEYATNVITLSTRFHTRFKNLLRDEFDESSITRVQALLVMSSALAGVGEEKNSAWIYSGIAFRMMFDLGLHTAGLNLSPAQQISAEDSEIRRRLFWSAFVIDKVQSFYYGRPPAIQESDVTVPVTFLDHYTELESWIPMDARDVLLSNSFPIFEVSNAVRLCKLSVIMNRVLNQIYGERQRFRSSSSTIQSLNTLNQELLHWYETTPLHLKFSPTTVGKEATIPSPHTFAVIMTYHVLQILLHRPFLSYGHLHTQLPNVALDSFSTCSSAATSIALYLESYERAHTFLRVPYFLFYAAYVSAAIHVRIAAQNHIETNAISHLLTSLRLFDMNKNERSSGQKAKFRLERLMMRLGVECPNMDTSFRPIAQSQQRGPSPTQASWSNPDIVPGAQQQQTSPTVDTHSVSELWDMGRLDVDALFQGFKSPSQNVDSTSRPPETLANATEFELINMDFDLGSHELYGFETRGGA